MARNKYPGRRYCCGQWIEPGYGYFDRVHNAKPGQPKWRVKCVKCASGRALTDKDPGVVWAKKMRAGLAFALCPRVVPEDGTGQGGGTR